jgi:SOS-response transcriptional repressor LexA
LIGPDLVVRNGQVITDAGKRAKTDKSISGFKKLHKKNPSAASKIADEIIKNTYRTLMTRGQKGCFIWSSDRETRQYFQRVMGVFSESEKAKQEPYPGLPLRILDANEVQPFRNCVPVFDLPIAAGEFGPDSIAQSPDWVELPDGFTPKEGFFVVRVCGESMNRRIPNGSWCLFRSNPAGSRQGKVVIVRHHAIQDPENGGSYTVKIYDSVKQVTDDSWSHQLINLHPDSNTPGFKTINLKLDDATEFKIIGEFVANLGKT